MLDRRQLARATRSQPGRWAARFWMSEALVFGSRREGSGDARGSAGGKTGAGPAARGSLGGFGAKGFVPKRRPVQAVS